MRTTKYIEGEIIKIESGQLLIVQRMVLTHTKCRDDCYFGSKFGYNCYSGYQNELPTKLACGDLIPSECCFKLLKEGV